MAQTTLDIVRTVANDYGVPEWVWRPIMLQESGGNPGSWNDPKRNGGVEDSRGLFQINIKAHPQWKNLNLFDPAVNARIAFANFIAPTYYKVQNDSSLSSADKTAYVWRYGIRPKWTDQKAAAIKRSTAQVITELTATQPGSQTGFPSPSGVLPWGSPGFGGGDKLAPGGPGSPGGLGPGIKEQQKALNLDNNPDYLTLIPSNSWFPGVHIGKSTVFTTVLWIAGIIAVLAFVLMISRSNTVIMKEPNAEGGAA